MQTLCTFALRVERSTRSLRSPHGLGRGEHLPIYLVVQDLTSRLVAGRTMEVQESQRLEGRGLKVYAEPWVVVAVCQGRRLEGMVVPVSPAIRCP